jgi:hypothetical protein
MSQADQFLARAASRRGDRRRSRSRPRADEIRPSPAEATRQARDADGLVHDFPISAGRLVVSLRSARGLH